MAAKGRLVLVSLYELGPASRKVPSARSPFKGEAAGCWSLPALEKLTPQGNTNLYPLLLYISSPPRPAPLPLVP